MKRQSENKSDLADSTKTNSRMPGRRRLITVLCIVLISIVIFSERLNVFSPILTLTPTSIPSSTPITTVTPFSPYSVSGKLAGKVILSASELIPGKLIPYIYTVDAVSGVITRLPINEYAARSTGYYGGDIVSNSGWGVSRLLASSPDRRFQAYGNWMVGKTNDALIIVDNQTHQFTSGIVTSVLPPAYDCNSIFDLLWSPDGLHIAYKVGYAKYVGQDCVAVGLGIYIEDRLTGIARRIESIDHDGGTALLWSPDSTFLLDALGGLTKWSQKKGSWQAQTIAERVDGFWISPDSTRIFYTEPLFVNLSTLGLGSGVRGKDCLRAINADGSTLTTVMCLADDLGFKDIAIAPNGKYIAGLVGQFFQKIYVGREQGALIVMDIDGSHFMIFSEMGGNSLAWSPNSSYLAILSDAGAIGIIGIDGCCAKMIPAVVNDPVGIMLGWED